eukprot:CAMPEP_0202456660 /NCGR_PEP_ID=MMETSP1360-20130828/13859_1 /ASSEMBLY_ACC=CAM_ASM_000848 /TAXON_ID=515479 /ORGANISM="Licmophora paradoxa, Strain CCMP2313" /LENGTH=347 /DNA_ID=CAMNT_0049076531 /DNA_START=620 /DNA_END=1663 /DNA_ORIENTATION=+
MTSLMLLLLIYDIFGSPRRGSAAAAAASTTAPDNNIPTRNTIYAIVGIYTLCHSFSAHKEFRFLLPMLPLLCIRSGSVLADWFSALNNDENKNNNKNNNNKNNNDKRKGWAVCVRPDMKMAVVLIMIVTNTLAFCYLGLFHQAAPLSVTKSLVQRIQQKRHQQPGAPLVVTTTHRDVTIRIHFLMGCHSTPLYSHLHLGPSSSGSMAIDPWYLDCSPSCRSTQTCESDRFHGNPRKFVADAYGLSPSSSTSSAAVGGEDYCKTERDHVVPDYLVMYAEQAHEVRDLVVELGMRKVDRFVHGINGARLLGSATLGRENYENDAFSKYNIVSDMLTISVDEMILFEKRI